MSLVPPRAIKMVLPFCPKTLPLFACLEFGNVAQRNIPKIHLCYGRLRQRHDDVEVTKINKTCILLQRPENRALRNEIYFALSSSFLSGDNLKFEVTTFLHWPLRVRSDWNSFRRFDFAFTLRYVRTTVSCGNKVKIIGGTFLACRRKLTCCENMQIVRKLARRSKNITSLQLRI